MSFTFACKCNQVVGYTAVHLPCRMLSPATCKELEGEVSFRHVNAHVFILNAFGVIEKAWRNGPWMMQFDAIRPLLELFANNDSPVPIVVLLRAFWDPPRYSAPIALFELEKFQRIHDCVPLGIAMFVPTPEMLNECFAK